MPIVNQKLVKSNVHLVDTFEFFALSSELPISRTEKKVVAQWNAGNLSGDISFYDAKEWGRLDAVMDFIVRSNNIDATAYARKLAQKVQEANVEVPNVTAVVSFLKDTIEQNLPDYIDAEEWYDEATDDLQVRVLLKLKPSFFISLLRENNLIEL